MKFRFLMLSALVGAASLALSSCSVANSLGGYASRMTSAVTRAIR